MTVIDYKDSHLPFKGGFQVVQFYADKPEAYKEKFGLHGHEGVDIIPYKNDWTIHAVEDGVVVDHIEGVKSVAYGSHLVVWNKEHNRMWWYCHLTERYVKKGTKVKKGEAIGLMGKTGKTKRAHLHVSLRHTDSEGNALGSNNGFEGFIDPLPFIVGKNS